jgi:hypothetical protein
MRLRSSGKRSVNKREYMRTAIVVLICGILTGCGLPIVTPPQPPDPYYGPSLVSVSVNGKDAPLSGEQYCDSAICARWFSESNRKIDLEIKNLKAETLQIPWNDVVYVDENGESQRVIHNSVIMQDRGSALPPTSIAPNAKMVDSITPTNRIKHVSGWYLKGRAYPGRYDFGNLFPEETLGKRVSVLMPIQTAKGRSEYLFTFEVKSIVQSTPAGDSASPLFGNIFN